MEGKYANYFTIGHNMYEFVLDFGQRYGDEEEGRMHTRIIMSPAYARELLATLGDALEQYQREETT